MFHNDLYEDDVFYREIRKQILLLTADDEENELLETNHPANPILVNNQSSKRSLTTMPISNSTQSGNHFGCWDHSESSGSLVPTWATNLQRNGNGGTGVFIPHIVKSRRRRRSGMTFNVVLHVLVFEELLIMLQTLRKEVQQ
ncbi:hypothetical protein Tsubulata_022100 [Turnera subulata]|uniref:Uncharacterized protein n=1 Tax=Turnera subulata TaxID=218843 RepID=A0A9Q0FEC8_9ROSI|nr:hypothetical protein Tsubulata_022100 [Turnera subulata]